VTSKSLPSGGYLEFEVAFCDFKASIAYTGATRVTADTWPYPLTSPTLGSISHGQTAWRGLQEWQFWARSDTIVASNKEGKKKLDLSGK
jgi:hypothetical protein